MADETLAMLAVLIKKEGGPVILTQTGLEWFKNYVVKCEPLDDGEYKFTLARRRGVEK